MYSFIYSINYLGFNIKSLSRPVSATLYHGYSLVIVLAIMHATITIGFFFFFAKNVNVITRMMVWLQILNQNLLIKAIQFLGAAKKVKTPKKL